MNQNKSPVKYVWDKQWKNYNLAPFFKPNNKVIQEIARCFDNNLKNKKIIELGAGSGCDIICLTKMGAKGYAVDFSSESVKTMRYWSKKTKVKLNIRQGDIRKLPYQRTTFDMVYSVGLMEHFEDPLSLLKFQLSIIKPGGFLLIDVPQKYSLYTIAKHVRMKYGLHPFGWETQYSVGELRNIAKKLRQKVFRFYGRDLDLIQKIPVAVRPFFTSSYSKFIENTFVSPHISLSIGLIIKVV